MGPFGGPLAGRRECDGDLGGGSHIYAGPDRGVGGRSWTGYRSRGIGVEEHGGRGGGGRGGSGGGGRDMSGGSGRGGGGSGTWMAGLRKIFMSW